MSLMNEKQISELINEYSGISEDFSDIYAGNYPQVRYAQELSYSELDF